MIPIRRSGMDPIRRFKDEFDSMFDRFFKEPFFSDNTLFRKDSFLPVCNIEEQDKKYVIEAEMPGVDPDNIEIEIDGKQLSIKGTREKEVTTEDEERQMHMVERSYGSFYRSFTLPNNVDTENITADYKNGVLFIDIPKLESEQTRKIKIERKD